MTVERRGEYLGTRATHHDGELVGITLALQHHKGAHVLAVLSDSKAVLQAVTNIDTGIPPSRSTIEA